MSLYEWLEAKPIHVANRIVYGSLLAYCLIFWAAVILLVGWVAS